MLCSLISILKICIYICMTYRFSWVLILTSWLLCCSYLIKRHSLSNKWLLRTSSIWRSSHAWGHHTWWHPTRSHRILRWLIIIICLFFFTLIILIQIVSRHPELLLWHLLLFFCLLFNVLLPFNLSKEIRLDR